MLLLRAIRRYLRAVFRVTELACLAAPIAVAVPIARTFSPWAPGLEDRAWNLVTSALERGGPVFIKLAQWAATREDLFPVALTAKFSRLQDQTKLHSWAETERREVTRAWRALAERAPLTPARPSELTSRADMVPAPLSPPSTNEDDLILV